MSKLKIALISGGWSREREISLMGGKCVLQALNKETYDVVMYDPQQDIKKIVERSQELDLAFILLHGKYGEDGCIQGLMEILRIPYVGSGVLASAMAVNKKTAKTVYRSDGLPVPKDRYLTNEKDVSTKDIVRELGQKTVVKPLDEGSSFGISVCENEAELKTGIEKAFMYGNEIMVEEFIKGTEITCCVLGNHFLETLPVIEIVPNEKYKFFDYEAKYTSGATNEICPARIDTELEKQARFYASRAHKALGCSVWSRTDMIIRGNEIFMLETNTIPGMTQNSLFPLAARTAGMSFSDLLEKLIALSLEK